MNKEMSGAITLLDWCGIKYMPLRKDKTPVRSGWAEDGFSVDKEDMEGHQLGILTGKRSGITVVDVDFIEWGRFGTDPSIFPDTYTVQTPTGAIQKYYMYDERIGQSQKSLDSMPCVDIRNDGGYVMAPPSTANYWKTLVGEKRHMNDETYKVISGDIINLAPFPFELFEKDVKEAIPVEDLQPYIPTPSRPGDDFESTTSWDQILVPHGFKRGHLDRNGSTHWMRPGKDTGTAGATTRKCDDGRERLFVFSTNANPFETYDKAKHNSYSKLRAYALLNNSGDFSKTIRDLREQGYGAITIEQEPVQVQDIAQPVQAEDKSTGMQMTCVADLVEEPIDWLWRGKIARGELCIIAGEPGASKTMVSIDLASRVSNGSNEPLGYTKMCKGSVVF
jgi:hypothetical protein